MGRSQPRGRPTNLRRGGGGDAQPKSIWGVGVATIEEPKTIGGVGVQQLFRLGPSST